MIQTIYQIGLAIKDLPKYSEYFELWGNPFPGKERDARVLLIEVKEGKFSGLTEEVFRPAYLKKYLFKVGSTSGRGTNPVPTVPLTDKNKSFEKIKQSFKVFGHDFINKNQLQKIKEAIDDHKFNTKTSYLLTFKINGKYLGEIDTFEQLLNNRAFDSFYKKKYGVEIESKCNDYICSLTGNKSEVLGFVNSLGFTVNDPAYMRNGFDQKDAYKMFPVSKEAIKILDGAKKLIFNEFSNSFTGKKKYILLPKCTFSNRPDLIQEIFISFKEKKPLNINTERYDLGTNGFINESETLIDEIIHDEKLSGNEIYYDLLFYEIEKSNLSLFMQVSDIRPSRLKRIMEKKRHIESFYASITNFHDNEKNTHYEFHINLTKLQELLLTEQGRNSKAHPYFYKIVEAIFYGEKINQTTFERFLIQGIKKAFKQLHENQYGLSTKVKEGFVFCQFLSSLDLFNNQKSLIMEQENEKVKMDALQFISQHSSFFTSDYKKGAFIFGCLIARLLYNQPGNAFLRELKDLSIDKDLVEKKFPKLIAKLRQYGLEFRKLEQNASVFLTSDDKISKDEISFAVTLGMILQKEFDIKNNKLKEVETEQGKKFELIVNDNQNT